MKWYLHACPTCEGDLHDDIEEVGWVTCFMCGRSYKRNEVLRPRALEDTRPLFNEDLPQAA